MTVPNDRNGHIWQECAPHAASHHRGMMCKRGEHFHHIIPGTKKCLTCAQLKGENPTNAPMDGEQYDTVMALTAMSTNDWYLPVTRCPGCGTTAERSLSGRCRGCESKPKPSPRQAALMAGETWYTPDKPCGKCHTTARRRVVDGRCEGCMNKAATAELSPRQAALAAGETWYTPTHPCKVCGTTAPRRVNNGACQACTTGDGKLTPRQLAIKAGEAWYTPEEPCKVCETIAPRRVANGSCRACEARTRATTASCKDTPRTRARAAGETWYWTGEACDGCGVHAPRHTQNGYCKACRSMTAAERWIRAGDHQVVEEDGLRIYRDGNGDWHWVG